ncbi:hypothetical protein M3Y97_00981200 [Aphelenchoides bicaudatus]|nr:hypothetical protein M3Y97_00981200 [Aphelenchoides bicaudatus]
MYKVLRSYSRKSERKHDATGQPPHHTSEYSHWQTSNGQGGGGAVGHRDGPFVTSPPASVRNGGTHSLRRGSRERGGFHDATYSSEFREGGAAAAGEYRNGGHHHSSSRSHRSGGVAHAGESGGRYYDTAFSAHSGGRHGRYNQSSEHHQLHRHSARGQGFSESSSYETREHFERKVQRVKKKGEARAVKAAEEVHVRAIKVG